MADNPRLVKRALLSLSDKSGLIELAKILTEMDIELISTGGTSKMLKDAGLKVTDVSSITDFPEIMDGRVKTLHPKIHGGLLAMRDNAAHEKAQQTHGIENIDLLIVNLYPFEATVARDASFEDTIENIDIGGPAMIRAAAKNHDGVTTIVDVDDYDGLIEELKANDRAVSATFRRQMAAKAFSRTANYDAAISNWFMAQNGETAPKWKSFSGTLSSTLRYGENPHQEAAYYTGDVKRPGIATATLIQGKALSYNNLNDTDAAFELVSEFAPKISPAVAIIKHANPCGAARGESLLEAYKLALRTDPVSAFGGIVALNQELDGTTAEEIIKTFTEVIIAPSVSDEAKTIISKKKNLRLMETGGLANPAEPGLYPKALASGFLVQGRDNKIVNELDLKVVTKRAPTNKELADLKFAFQVAKHVKSNAIIYARDLVAVGIGAGQMSRIDSTRIAALKAKEAAETAGLKEPLTIGSVVASDAFFPFPDGLLAAAEAGATAVIQPGGSIRDDEVIAAADEKNIAMVFTGVRHFRH